MICLASSCVLLFCCVYMCARANMRARMCVWVRACACLKVDSFRCVIAIIRSSKLHTRGHRIAMI